MKTDQGTKGKTAPSKKSAAKPANKQLPVAKATPREDPVLTQEQQLSAESAATRSQRMIASRRLVTAIRKKLIDKNMGEREIADMIGITPVYWNTLVNGYRDLAGLRKDKMQKLAEFLELPLIQVYVMAGAFDIGDFVVQSSAEADVNRMVEFMRADPRWIALAPSEDEWEALPSKVKMLISALYEVGSHKKFLSSTKAFVESEAQ